jgi:UDP-N-acetylmuramyl pentapeptide synthase
MDRIFPKIFYQLKKPKTVIVIGDERTTAAEAVFLVLSKHGKTKKIGTSWPLIVSRDETVIAEKNITADQDFKEAAFLANHSSLPVVVITRLNAGGDGNGQQEALKKFLGSLSNREKPVPKIVYNADQPDLKKAFVQTAAENKTGFGFSPEAEFRASDMRIAKELNFKVNVGGNIIPVWLSRAFGEEQVLSVLAAMAVGRIFGLNLIQTTQAAKEYRSAPGRMNFVNGVNGTFILDNTRSKDGASDIQALDILEKIQGFRKKIAILGKDFGYREALLIRREVISSLDSIFIVNGNSTSASKGGYLEKIRGFATMDGVVEELAKKTGTQDLILISGRGMEDILAKLKAALLT